MATNFFNIKNGVNLGSQSSEPSGINGDMYYNSTLGKFRQFQNGNWHDVGSGSGGATNFVANGDAESGNIFTTYANTPGAAPLTGTGGSPTILAAVTSSSSPLSGLNSFLLAKDAAANRQGQGWSVPFTIDQASEGRVLTISFDYIVAAGSFAAGSSTTDSDMTVWIYDITNSILIQPTNYKLFSNSSTLAAQFLGQFQAASNSTSYRLIFHLGTTATTALTMKIDSVSVSPGIAGGSGSVTGSITTDWVPYTPTFTGFGTPTGVSFFSRRVGDSLEVHGVFTSGTVSSTPSLVTIGYQGSNSNVTIDSTKLGVPQIVGHGTQSGFSGAFFSTEVTAGTGSTLHITGQTNSSGGTTNSNADFLFATGAIITIKALVPIVGWSSNVAMSSAFSTNDVSASYTGAPPTGTLTNSFNTVTYPTKIYDTTNSYSGGVFTVPVSGSYDINAGVDISATILAGAGLSAIGISINGAAPVRYQQSLRQSATSTEANISITDLNVNLRAGDTVAIQSYTDGSSPSFGSNAALNYFNIVKRNSAQTIASPGIVALKYYNTASPAITNATTILTFPTKEFDTTASYNTGTGIFTAPIAGLYQVSVGIRSATGMLANNDWQLDVRKNTSTIQMGNSKAGTGASDGFNAVHTSGLVQLNAGDTLQVNSFTAAASITLTGDNYNQLSINRIP